MKKSSMVALIAGLSLASIMTQTSFASTATQTDAPKNTNSYVNDVSQKDATKVALVFMVNDILHNPNSKWNKDTKCSQIIPMYDENNNVTGYAFVLSKNDQDNGYIVVSGSTKNDFIPEFSYVGKPSFLNSTNQEFDKVIYDSPTSFVLQKDNEFTTLDRHKVDKKDLKNHFVAFFKDNTKNKKLLNDLQTIDSTVISSWTSNQPQSSVIQPMQTTGISDPVTYLQNNFGGTWTYNSSNFISGVVPHTQYGFLYDTGPQENNCVLSTLATIFEFWRNSGYYKITENTLGNVHDIYNKIHDIAVADGYYTPNSGVGWSNVSYLADAVWQGYGYSGYTGDYWHQFFTNGYPELQTEVNSGRPFPFLIGYDTYYNNHCVTGIGWALYDTTGDQYPFIAVYDNWTTQIQYVDWRECPTSSSSYVQVIPPSTK